MSAHPVTIENDALLIEVWPQLGGKVSSVVDKHDGFDLMFNYPAELPQGPSYDTPYVNAWYAGWDECFPAVSGGRYPGHPYDGIAVPDHGELWGLPTTAVPTKDGITTVWHGIRFGYRLTRKLYLDGPSVHAEYTLINLAPFEFRFVWAMHSLMALQGPVELGIGEGLPFRFSHDGEGKELQQGFEWPVCDGMDVSQPEELPAKRAWKLFSVDPIGSPAVVKYPSRGRGLRIGYTGEEDLEAYWGVWVNTGGWNGQRHFAVEPTTGRFNQVDRAVRDGSAARVAAMSRRDWAVQWTVEKLP